MDNYWALAICIALVLAAILPGFIASQYDHKHQVAVWVATLAILAHTLFYVFDLVSTGNLIVQIKAQDRLWFSMVGWVGTLVWACMAVDSRQNTHTSSYHQPASKPPAHVIDEAFLHESNARMRRMDGEASASSSAATGTGWR